MSPIHAFAALLSELLGPCVGCFAPLVAVRSVHSSSARTLFHCFACFSSYAMLCCVLSFALLWLFILALVSQCDILFSVRFGSNAVSWNNSLLAFFIFITCFIFRCFSLLWPCRFLNFLSSDFLCV